MTWPKEWLIPALSPIYVLCFHIHSKTACRGTNACQWHASYEPTGATAQTKFFCPCQKSQVSQLRYLTFFVRVRNVLATRCGCALRSACRGVSERRWHASYEPTEPPCETTGRRWRQAPTEAAAETSPARYFLLASRCFTSGCTCPHPLSSPPAPKTHPVLSFSGFFGCVFVFFALLDVQNFGTCFCALCRIALQVEVVGDTS